MSVPWKRVGKTLGITVAIVLAVAFALMGVEYSLRGSPLSRVTAVGDHAGAPPVGDALFLRTMTLFTGTSYFPGSEVDLLVNGVQTYPRLWADLRTAQHTLTLQFYYFEPGRMADTLKSIVIERARAGVQVLFLADAFGAQHMTRGYIDSLKAAGVRFASFRPLHWYALQKAQNRSHIRVVVVDGRIAYTGGFGIADKWFGNGHTQDEWRDTDVRFTGPAVAQLQATFANGWVEATGQLLTGDVYFPSLPPAANGATFTGLLDAEPTIGSTPAERFYALTIAGARQRLYITNSYFVPDDDFRRLLIAAAQRGVDVRVLTAGPRTDVKTVRWAGRAHYEELLTGGVRIYEYQPAMMHAKTLVADGIWSSIGSMNFDNRSVVFNNESNLNVLDSRVGASMDSLFRDDLKYSTEITLANFGRRGIMDRVMEKICVGLSRLL